MYTSTLRGVSPLLEWLDAKTDMRGFSAADRVVGKAAAFLYVLLGAKAVYADVMSRPALEVLVKNGIGAEYGKLVDAIFNRTNTGYCPMEMAVWDIEDAALVPNALKKRLAELRAGI